MKKNKFKYLNEKSTCYQQQYILHLLCTQPSLCLWKEKKYNKRLPSDFPNQQKRIKEDKNSIKYIQNAVEYAKPFRTTN